MSKYRIKQKAKQKQLRLEATTQRSASAPTATDYEGWFYGMNNATYSGGRFGYIGVGGGENVGIYDYRVPPMALNYVVQDPVVFGMIRVIYASLFKNNWAIMGGNRKAKLYAETLKTLGWDKVQKELVQAWIGSGGGNALIWFEKSNVPVYMGGKEYQKIQLKCEPFLAEGKYRVRIYPDYAKREISKYEILDWSQSVLKTLDKDHVIHSVYISTDGDFRFGNSPAIVATRAANLKYSSFVASELVYANGMNFSKAISPDYSNAKDVEMLKVMQDNWIGFTNLLEQTTGLRNRSKDLVSKIPTKIEKIGVNNVEMQTIALIETVQKELQASYGVALSNLGFTESANYSTSEQNRENVSELNTDWLQQKLAETVTEILSMFFDDYDPELYPYIQSYDPSAEDIQIRGQNIETFNTFLTAEKTLPGQFEIGDDVLESLGLSRKKQAESIPEPATAETKPSKDSEVTNGDQQQAIEENKKGLKDSQTTKSRSNLKYQPKTKDTPSTLVVKTELYSKFEDKIQKALVKQIEKTISNIEKTSVEELGKGNFKVAKFETFYSFPAFKKDLIEFGKLGAEIFNGQVKKHTRADDDVFGVFGHEVYDYIDKRTSELLKGTAGFSGLDEATAGLVETIITDNITTGLSQIVKAIRENVDGLTVGRAKRIAQTESGNAVEKSQYIMFKNEYKTGYKQAQTSVFDVCPGCMSNEGVGRIPINDDFPFGGDSPLFHPTCRCTCLYYESETSNY